jgi:signal transduction histidine kinase
MESGELKLVQQPVDLLRMLRTLSTQFATESKEKRFQLIFERSPGLPHWIIADAPRLEQVRLACLR